MFLPFPRATLLVPSGPDHDPDRKHLFIVLTQPDATQRVLMVGISSVVPGQVFDSACPLFKGDHPFIRHASYVRYRDAQVIAAQKLVDGVKTGKLIAREPLNGAVMARVINGIMASRFVAPKVRDYYLENTKAQTG